MASRFFVLWFQSEKIFESEYFTTGLPNRPNLKLFERKGPRPFMIGQADLGDFSATSASPNCQSSMFERQECEAARAARSMRLDFLGNTKSHLYWYFRSMEIPTDWFVSKTMRNRGFGNSSSGCLIHALVADAPSARPQDGTVHPPHRHAKRCASTRLRWDLGSFFFNAA